jgi:hypothetical protein
MSTVSPKPVSEEAKQRLITFFATNPAWMSAAKPLGEGVSSRLYFAGDEREWRLIRRKGVSVLEPGPAENPDFSFTFTEGAVDYMTELQDGSIGDFATRMYECCFLLDDDQRIDFQVVSSVAQVIRRNYWIIVLKGGFKVLKIARQHGIGGVQDFKRLFGLLRGKNSAEVRAAILNVRKDAEDTAS